MLYHFNKLVTLPMEKEGCTVDISWGYHGLSNLDYLMVRFMQRSELRELV